MTTRPKKQKPIFAVLVQAFNSTMKARDATLQAIFDMAAAEAGVPPAEIIPNSNFVRYPIKEHADAVAAYMKSAGVDVHVFSGSEPNPSYIVDILLLSMRNARRA